MDKKPPNKNVEPQESEQKVAECYSTWAQSYYDDYYGEKAPYPPVHVNIVRNLIKNMGSESKKLLDAGCGPASMLRELTDLGIDLYGFDLTPEMVQEAREVMARHGFPRENLWAGSVLDEATFRKPPGEYDITVCFGVLPHIEEQHDQTVIANLYDSLAPGGMAILEARNQLFAMFTFNRYSHEFFSNDLLNTKDLLSRAGEEKENLDKALEDLSSRFRLDIPPVRKGKEDEPGYDEVISRTHNPFVLRSQFEKQGFREVVFHFYHYHPLPPMYEKAVPKLFRREALAMEQDQNWRGFFIASAFVLSGRKE